MASLADVPFDINSLIPYDNFNWDCVDGIDCVTEDLMGVYRNIVGTIVDSLEARQKLILELQKAAVAHLVGSIELVEASARDVNQSIYRHIMDGLAPAMASSISTTDGLDGWIVLRESDCGVWNYRLELWGSPPANRVAYGPYPNVSRFLTPANRLAIAGTLNVATPQYDEGIKAYFDSVYFNVADWHSNMGDSDPTVRNIKDSYGQDYTPLAISEAICGAEPILPIVGVGSPEGVHFEGDYREFATLVWTYKLVPSASLNEPSIPAMVSSDNRWLNIEEYQAMEQWGRDNIGYTGPFLPPIVDTPIVPPIDTGLIDDGIIPTKVVNTLPTCKPTETVSNGYPQYSIGDTSSITDCCRAIVDAIDRLTMALAPKTESTIEDGDVDVEMDAIPETKYVISQTAEDDAQLFFAREGITISDSGENNTIGGLLDRMIGEASSLSIDS